jgi:uncharacterized protein (UPF0261 family)
MRTTPEENARIGAHIAKTLSAAKGPVAILLPGRGISAIDKEGQPFYDPVARKALHDAIRSGISARGPAEESQSAPAGGPRALINDLDLHINDPAFADAAARTLLELMKMNR